MGRNPKIIEYPPAILDRLRENLQTRTHENRQSNNELSDWLQDLYREITIIDPTDTPWPHLEIVNTIEKLPQLRRSEKYNIILLDTLFIHDIYGFSLSNVRHEPPFIIETHALRMIKEHLCISGQSPLALYLAGKTIDGLHRFEDEEGVVHRATYMDFDTEEVFSLEKICGAFVLGHELGHYFYRSNVAWKEEWLNCSHSKLSTVTHLFESLHKAMPFPSDQHKEKARANFMEELSCDLYAIKFVLWTGILRNFRWQQLLEFLFNFLYFTGYLEALRFFCTPPPHIAPSDKRGFPAFMFTRLILMPSLITNDFIITIPTHIVEQYKTPHRNLIVDMEHTYRLNNHISENTLKSLKYVGWDSDQHTPAFKAFLQFAIAVISAHYPDERNELSPFENYYLPFFSAILKFQKAAMDFYNDPTIMHTFREKADSLSTKELLFKIREPMRKAYGN